MSSGGFRAVLDAALGGPARRRRRMLRRLRELDRLDALARTPEEVLWPGRGSSRQDPRGWTPTSPDAAAMTRSPSSWWERSPRWGAIVVVLVIAGVVVWPSKVKALFPARAERPAGVDIPSRSEEASDERLLPPVSVAGTPDPSSFGWSTEQDNGSGPVAFDPCRPIHYVTRATDPETRDVSVIHEAVAAVSEASGLKFSYDGSTDERPTKSRAPFQRDRYGDRWAPVLIAWTDPIESPELTGYAGLGGGIPWRDTSGRVSYVSGTVWLDTAALHASRREAEGRDRIRALVMHELAHVLGAAHVTDRSQVMAEKGGTTLKLGRGDRYALSVLGQGRCTPGL